MKRVLSAALLLAALETTAMACSCIDSDDPAELERLAPDSARDAIALIEVQALTAFDPARGGEDMKVVRTLAGQSAPRFKVERGRIPFGASCDVVYRQGEKALMILYPAKGGTTAGSVPVYRTSGLCTAHLLTKPAFRRAVIQLIVGPSYKAERGL